MTAVECGDVETPVTKKMHGDNMVPKTAVVSALADALVAARTALADDQETLAPGDPNWSHQMSGSDAQAVRSPTIRTTDVRCGK